MFLHFLKVNIFPAKEQFTLGSPDRFQLVHELPIRARWTAHTHPLAASVHQMHLLQTYSERPLGPGSAWLWLIHYINRESCLTTQRATRHSNYTTMCQKREVVSTRLWKVGVFKWWKKNLRRYIARLRKFCNLRTCAPERTGWYSL